MNPMQDDNDFDTLLRRSFDGPTPDAGFSDRVMQQIPARRSRSAWPLAAGVFAGFVLCWLSLFQSPLWRTAWHDWFAGAWSATAIIPLAIMAGLSLLALAWTLAEADDH
ncbi:MAG TPA: hypothetical protein VGH80_03210 [Xanthomonadaceae bacterium]|jgi:hypothetical protein